MIDKARHEHRKLLGKVVTNEDAGEPVPNYREQEDSVMPDCCIMCQHCKVTQTKFTVVDDRRAEDVEYLECLAGPNFCTTLVEELGLCDAFLRVTTPETKSGRIK